MDLTMGNQPHDVRSVALHELMKFLRDCSMEVYRDRRASMFHCSLACTPDTLRREVSLVNANILRSETVQGVSLKTNRARRWLFGNYVAPLNALGIGA